MLLEYLLPRLPASKFLSQVSVAFLTQLVSLSVNAGNIAIVARWLGVEGSGMLALVLLVPGMSGLFLSSGIGVANVYFASSRRLDVPTLTANSVGFAILATIFGLSVVGGLAAVGWIEALMPRTPPYLVLFAMLGLPVRLLNIYLSAILQGLQRIVAVSVANLVQDVLTLALTILLVIGFRLALFGALLASLGAGILGLYIISELLRREGGIFMPRWDLSVMCSTLSFGLRGHIGNIFQFFNYRLDMFIVNYFLGPAGVGIYSVSVRFAELLWYFPSSVGFVIFPKAAATEPTVMNALTPRVFRVTFGLTALGALVLALLGRFLIQFVYSSAFVDAYVPMLVLLPGVVFLGGAKVLTNEISGRGYPHYNSISAGLALILTVALDFILVPQYGAVGAAFVSSIAYTAVFFLTIVFSKSLQRQAACSSQQFF